MVGEESRSEPEKKRKKKIKIEDGEVQWGLLDILFPLPMVPIKGIIFVSQKLKKAAKEQQTDKASIQEEMLELQMRYEIGELDDGEYAKKEAELVDRLEEIRKFEEEET